MSQLRDHFNKNNILKVQHQLKATNKHTEDCVIISYDRNQDWVFWRGEKVSFSWANMALLPAVRLLSVLHRSGCCRLGRCSAISAAPKNTRGNREHSVWQRGRSQKNTTPGPGRRRWRRAMETSFFPFGLGSLEFPAVEPAAVAHSPAWFCRPHLPAFSHNTKWSSGKDEPTLLSSALWLAPLSLWFYGAI